MNPASHPEYRAEQADVSDVVPVSKAFPVGTLAPVAAAPNKRWNIAADVVTKATEEFKPAVRDAVRWFARHCADRNLSYAEAGELLLKSDNTPYSGDSIYQSLSGRRDKDGKSLEFMAEAIIRYRRIVLETSAITSIAYIETPLTRTVIRVCRMAHRRQRIAFLFGASQIGKGVGLDEYQRQYDNRGAILIRFPTKTTYPKLIKEIARRLNIPEYIPTEQLRQRILNAIDDTMVLLLDEVHQALMGRGNSGESAIEFIREIYDRRKCGIVVCGTEVLRKALIHNPVLGQLWKRRSRALTITLKGEVPPAYLAKFDEAFGLGPAPTDEIKVTYLATNQSGAEVNKSISLSPATIQKQIVESEGIGTWVRLMEDAKDLAESKNIPLTWKIVLTQFCIAEAQERGEA